MTQMPATYGSYKDHQHEGETLREAEARALLSCASRLQRACDTACNREDYGEAIQLNQQLWTIFQASLIEAENPLPVDLRTLLLNLARYVDKVSFRALAEAPAPHLLRSLIQINRNIAAGLSVLQPKASGDASQPAITSTATAAGRDSIMTMA
jgi:flagellar protein FlaF